MTHPAHRSAKLLAVIALATGLLTSAGAAPAVVTSQPDASGMLAAATYPVPKHTGGWFGQARAYLDMVGGRGYELVADAKCGTAKAPTCSNARGTIRVGPAFAKLPHATKVYQLTMRVALQKQYEIAPTLDKSAAFKKAGADRSQLAWCMAVVKKTGYKTNLKCTTAQLELARAVWAGKVPSIAKVTRIVAVYKDQGSPISRPASTGTWLNEARAYLNAVGGKSLKLTSAKKTDCNGSKGCYRTNGGPTVYIRGDLWQKMTHRQKVWLMMHEVAHFYQGKVTSKLGASKTYAKLYPKTMTLPLAEGHNPANPNFPLEHLANCMTMARGVVESTPMCTADQIAFAAGVWNGQVKP